MTIDTAILIVHAAATWFMTGLIWFVQIVHYPLFGSVGKSEFTTYEREHQRRTTLVVAPVMLIELATAATLCFRTTAADRTLALTGAALLAVIWASTWLLQVPLHNRLSTGYQPLLIRRLATSNWLRTAAWTARALITGALFTRAMP
ncbi:MAG: hypothetical protein Q8L55_09550 [Phycisphaerales bacterium]|nr:hypothetical protein [Phycisphaerales bacterium]